MQCLRKAADAGHPQACLKLADRMYGDRPYARGLGHVVDAATPPARFMGGHDVPRDVLTSVVGGAGWPLADRSTTPGVSA